MDPIEYNDHQNPQTKAYPLHTYNSRTSLDAVQPYYDQTPASRRWGARESSENLVSSAASIGQQHDRSISWERTTTSPPAAVRQPTVPKMDGYQGSTY